MYFWESLQQAKIQAWISRRDMQDYFMQQQQTQPSPASDWITIRKGKDDQ